jgi:hypothetical protein
VYEPSEYDVCSLSRSSASASTITFVVGPNPTDAFTSENPAWACSVPAIDAVPLTSNTAGKTDEASPAM